MKCPVCRKKRHTERCALLLAAQAVHEDGISGWVIPDPTKFNKKDPNYGFAILHVSTRSETVGFIIDHNRIEEVLNKRHVGYKIYPGLGYYEGAAEPSYTIILINGSYWLAPWDEFMDKVEKTLNEMVEALKQREILVELLRNGGSYVALSWEHPVYGHGPRQPVPVLRQVPLGPYPFPVA